MRRIKVEGRTGVFYRVANRIGGPGQEKVFYVTYKVGGKKIEAKAGRQYKNRMTPAKAERYRAKLIEGMEQTPQEKRAAKKAAEATENARWTINNLWDLYCENKADNKSIGNEKSKFEKYLRPEIGKKEPGELVALDIDRLRLRLQRKGKKTMAARVLELLRRTVNYGVNRGLVAPLSFKIEVPRLNNQTTEDLSPEQIKKLIKVLEGDEDQAAANVMRLALFTGMRRSEIYSLRWSAVDFRRGFITIEDPKGGQDATVPLNGMARAVLESIERDPDNPYVFPGRFPGQHLTNRGASHRRIAAAAGFPPGFRPVHGLRHVYASMLASSGKVDLYHLQKLMTHKSPLMTQRYAHLRDEALKQASEVAGDIVSGLAKKKEDKKVVSIESK